MTKRQKKQRRERRLSKHRTRRQQKKSALGKSAGNRKLLSGRSGRSLDREFGNLVSAPDAAAYLGVSTRHVRRLAEKGLIDNPLRGVYGSRSLIARVKSQADVTFVFDEDLNLIGKKEGSKTVPASKAEMKAAGLI